MFIVVGLILIPFPYIFPSKIMSLTVGLVMSLMVLIFAIWSYFRVKKIECEVKESNGRMSINVNPSFMKMVGFVIFGFIFSHTLTSYFDIDDMSIPAITMMGVLISGILFGYLSSQRDNEFRGKK